jgi:hypothetical protein
MPLKIKSRPVDEKILLNTVKPLVLHDVTNPASRRALIATQPASGTANHARHHVSRSTQS